VRAFALHLAAGIAWALFAIWIWFDRYALCVNEPDYLETVFFVLVAGWVGGAAGVGYIRARGRKVWPMTVAWFVVSSVLFATIVLTGPKPVSCSLF
jgi:hypothetical protein